MKNSQIKSEFEPEEFGDSFMGRVAYLIFHWRLPLLMIGIALTAFFAYSASKLEVSSGFSKMIPTNHEYMQTFSEYREVFGGADKALIAIQVKDGTIFQKEIIELIREVTESVFYIKGVERSSLTSLVTPNVRYNEVVEVGFRSGNLVPGDFTGTEEELEQVRSNVEKSDWVGRIVSEDMTSTMVVATLMPTEPGSEEPLDLSRVGAELEEIRQKYEGDQVSLHIIGFAKATSDIADGAASVLLFFALAFVVTAILLYWYSGSVMLSGWALIAALIPVVWLLGLLPIMGMGLDPMSILVPFLIFAIGVSHAVQMTNAWKLETLRGFDGVTASRNCFMKLFIPGFTALASTGVAFLVIAIVDIQIVQELAITSTIGVALMVLTNKILLPILLSYMAFSARELKKFKGHETDGNVLWEKLGWLATKKGAIVPLLLALVLTGFGFWKAQGLQIGDMGVGVPELWPDSTYNQDVKMITDQFAIGVDLLQVIVEIDSEDSPCVRRDVMEKIEKFDFVMRNTDGVAAVRSLPTFIGNVTQDFAEGWYKWNMLPETTPQIAQGVGMATRLGNEYRNSDCNALPVSIYLEDHKAPTIRHIVEVISDFKDQHDTDEMEFRLASGNVGVMAATNEVVSESQIVVNLAVFATVALMCLITFRSISITIAIVVPVALVTLLCNAIMAMMGIGVKVNTLPVIAIAVGMGVDYGIYMFERVKHEISERAHTLRDAFVMALKARATASVFTAVTMSVSVMTWTMSTLKFQADMGWLLAFMFMVNVFGAIFLAPAIAAFIVKDGKRNAAEN
ncbi:efflux RND transporter permease subunit [Marinobacter sp. NP-6]|uniref:efflux RND transporter permease subunit n=1 Tax=Marinobacter sp. NP-6 TaxID=2488666 RepID=UPI001C8E007F|nr:efflux RND transporter permease subunit [Marinobacter sp. NP-6]